MILALEMVAQREPMVQYDWKERRGIRVYQYAMAQGVLLRPIGNVVYFMPPYVINSDEIGLLARVAMAGIDLATREQA
jgi:adenosylmethionine-8-amino-7-oxononanoate aminotransferase